MTNRFKLALVAVWFCGSALQAGPSPESHFKESVQPLLELRCLSCHGSEKQKGGLRLDSREATMKGGDNGPAVVPGKPNESLLLQAVKRTKADLEMPPKEKLTSQDVAAIEKWIADGLPWPNRIGDMAALKLAPGEKLGDAWRDPRNPIRRVFAGQRLDLWSLKPIRSQTPPEVKNEDWAKNPIDRFILARLNAAHLKPSPEAAPRALARRLYFDLSGLPPTPAEMESFLNDKAIGAYERLVDLLLASPRYGEQAARQWLDVIRYSDSNGFDWDEFRPKAWRFRDYVIRSFNSDKPFNQFIREQLAGDELLAGAPRDTQEQDCLIATGYLRMGPHDNSAGAFNEQGRSRAELMSDLTETTASAFLGLTMGCCRCHDHKFDPLSQADHFRMRAFFEPVKFADDLPLDVEPEQQAIRVFNKAIDLQIKPLKREQDGLINRVKSGLEKKRSQLALEVGEAIELPLENQPSDLKQKIALLEKKEEIGEKEFLAAMEKNDREQYESLGQKIAALRKGKKSFASGLLMTDAEGNPPVTHLLSGGDYKQEREAVEPGFISALDPNPASISKPVNPKTSGRRLTLADWIVAADNPLTSRVLVNRAWQYHFGKALVSTANDFGLAGARPTHPELLDWLASEFMNAGWSMKKLHRLIVTSATYRQASTFDEAEQSRSGPLKPGDADGDNELLWRQNLRRLSAEQLRDSLLHVSGLLKESNGGPPIWPELPAEILQANPAFLDDNETKTKGWYPSPASERNVRSVYLIQKKTVRVPFMETFDLPENSASCARRNVSTVAPQALALLNSSLVFEAAQSFAARVKLESNADHEAQITRIFQLALQRPPDADELTASLMLLKERGLVGLCRALLNVNEFVYFD